MDYDTIEKLVDSFIGREITYIEFSDDDEAIFIGLNDGGEVELGKDSDGDLYLARNESAGAN